MIKPRKKNREVAERFGISISTVKRMVGRPRVEFLEERRALREKAARLRATGLTWEEIGAALGVSIGSARSMAKRSVGAWTYHSNPKPNSDRDHTVDMFEAVPSSTKSQSGASP